MDIKFNVKNVNFKVLSFWCLKCYFFDELILRIGIFYCKVFVFMDFLYMYIDVLNG